MRDQPREGKRGQQNDRSQGRGERAGLLGTPLPAHGPGEFLVDAPQRLRGAGVMIGAAGQSGDFLQRIFIKRAAKRIDVVRRERLPHADGVDRHLLAAGDIRGRSVPGGTSSRAYPPNITSPRRTRPGSAATKSLAAVLAASSRVGRMSWDRMLPLLSMARMMADRSAGTGSGTTGRATATKAEVSASSSRTAGRYLVNRLPRDAAIATRGVTGCGRDVGSARRSRRT